MSLRPAAGTGGEGAGGGAGTARVATFSREVAPMAHEHEHEPEQKPEQKPAKGPAYAGDDLSRRARYEDVPPKREEKKEGPYVPGSEPRHDEYLEGMKPAPPEVAEGRWEHE